MHRTTIFDKQGVTFFIALMVCALLCVPQGLAETTDQNTIRRARLTDMHGHVEIRRGSDSDWIAAQEGMTLYENDGLRTGRGSSADIKVTGGEMSEIRVMENSELTFDEMILHQATGLTDTLLYLAIGKILVTCEDLTPGSDYNVQTPTSLVGIRGTMFEVTVS